MKVAHETRSEGGSASSWRTHSTHANDIDYFSECLVFVPIIIPATLVHQLPQKFDSWLRTIFLLRRHIDIIDKQHSFSNFWPIKVFTSSVEPCVDDVLCLSGTCLCGEPNFD
jgi:hypothetical protein